MAVFICDVCSESFDWEFALNLHKLTHTGIKPAGRCEACKKMYFSENQYEKHKNTHKNYKCNECDQIFLKMSSLNIHRLRHRELIHKCEFCEKMFSANMFLTAHVKQCHMDKQHFSCATCNKKFLSKEHYRIHVFSHTGKKSFSCDSCEKSFYTQSKLRKHKLFSHSRVKCPVCSKTVNGDYYEKHMLIKHSETKQEYSHMCEFCGKTLVDVQTLNKHRRSHLYKPHACHICDKSFIFDYLLKTHLKTHKPNICHICNKRFSHAGSLTLHLKKHARDEQRKESENTHRKEKSKTGDAGSSPLKNKNTRSTRIKRPAKLKTARDEVYDDDTSEDS